MSEHAMDPDNPIIKLCIDGMRAEFQGRLDAAQGLFVRAWESARDDYEACVAAHFIARHQEIPAEMLRWNLEALERAGAADADSVREFYPSLYLNLGFSYEMLEQWAEAGRSYATAESRLADLPPGPYAQVVRDGISNGLQRIAAARKAVRAGAAGL